MVIGKIKPTATIVAQFAAGVEIEAIQHDGKMYLPVVGMGEFAATDTAPSKPSAPAKPADEKKDADEAPTDEVSKVYTEDELMEMDVKSLTKILKDEFGIDPNEYDGKNTNKKLRSLILDAQENGGEEPKKDVDENPKGSSKKPAKDEPESEEDSDLANQVAEILEDFDAGKKNKKKAISSICALVDDADEDSVTELIEKFEDDADADLDEIAEKIAKVLEGEKEPEKKPAKRGTKKSKDEDLVDVSDLKVGDRVSVWWEDYQEWYDGEVESIKRGKVTIAYDDDTDGVIDPEIHTKIKRLAD